MEVAGQGWVTSLLETDRGGNPDFEYSVILSSSDPALSLASLMRRTAPPPPAVPQQDAEGRQLRSLIVTSETS